MRALSPPGVFDSEGFFGGRSSMTHTFILWQVGTGGGPNPGLLVIKGRK